MDTLLVSIVSLGEGWHNYHHTFPWDYKAAEYGIRYNPTSKVIEFLAKIGWAYDLKQASDTLIKARVLRSGDGSHPNYEDKLRDDNDNFQKHLSRGIEKLADETATYYDTRT